jgi:hypothetical protein
MSTRFAQLRCLLLTCPMFLPLLVLGLNSYSIGDEPPKETTAKNEAHFPSVDSIKPLHPSEIPDDPPPHEGAMIDLPHAVEPPDLVLIEVLEARASAYQSP